MIKTRKENEWNIPEAKAIQQCADSRMGKYYGPYFWIITDSATTGMKHMMATENTSEAIDCHTCQYKSKCGYGKNLTGPMITIEEMIAKRAGKSSEVIKKEVAFFHQVKNLEVGKIEEVCKSFNRDCSRCPLAIHKSSCYTNNNHLCITGMTLYAFLSELDKVGSNINFI